MGSPCDDNLYGNPTVDSLWRSRSAVPSEVKHLLTGFIYGLFHAYCQEHGLFLSQDQKDETLSKIVQAR
jgi:hypothetical protein